MHGDGTHSLLPLFSDQKCTSATTTYELCIDEATAEEAWQAGNQG
jgi:hypothetical protein